MEWGKKMFYKNWKLLITAIFSFTVFIAISSVALWLSYKCNQFHSDDTERGIKGLMITMVGASIFLPLFYLLYTFVRVQNGNNELVMPSTRALLAIVLVSDALLIITSSLGIWMTLTCMNWEGNTTQGNAVEVTFIVFLVLSVLLPIIYGCVYYLETKKKII